MTNWTDRNRQVIEEFRSNGGNAPRGPLLLLSTTGAKTGQLRTNPVMYLQDGDRWIVFASKGGAPANPDWFHNLLANPTVTLEVGLETFEADATVTTGDERDRLYALQAERHPNFAEYQQRTARKIPVVAFTRKRGG